MGQIVLASQSPRRRDLLEQVGLQDFLVIPAQGEENHAAHQPPETLCEALALAKAQEVAALRPREDLVIAADTIVVLEQDGTVQVLGKPRDRDEAARMLEALSGRTHQVYTGLALMQDGRTVVDHEKTQVRFRPLTSGEIQAYLDTGEPMDKAGAYGIQGIGALLVEGIQGDYCNVVGLPLCRLGQCLNRLGFSLLGGLQGR